ncbi:hypothetical protein [Dactylosporangium maewongense]|uniref:hypothetical protein n=1 Tax=Dactylosporangium maewongense TaxID=634393 RepID=UPI0031E287B6
MEELPEACQQVGRALALAGCDLVVFSSADDYVEKDVVHGFVSVDGPGRVVVRTPQLARVDFNLSEEQAARVEIEADTADEWEVSYYRSVHLADGLVVIGGGRSTRIAGVLAIAQRIPIFALAGFGGGAAVVRNYLDKSRNDATAEDIVLMGRPWSADRAERLAASLIEQHRRRQAALAASAAAVRRHGRRRVFTALAAAATTLLGLSTVPLTQVGLPRAAALAALLAGPILAAIGGALLRETKDNRPQPEPLWSAVRGLGAGALTTTLYLSSQLLTSPDLDAMTLAGIRPFLLLIALGIASGYTVDKVFARVRHLDVMPTQPFPDINARAAAEPSQQNQ